MVVHLSCERSAYSLAADALAVYSSITRAPAPPQHPPVGPESTFSWVEVIIITPCAVVKSFDATYAVHTLC